MEALVSSSEPLWLIGLLVVGGAAVLSALGMVLIHERVHRLVMEGHNDVAGFLFATVGVIYGILLAFLVFAVWERYVAAETAVDDEASAEINLLRATRGLPDGVRQEVQGHLRRYADLVVNEEWPKMASGGSSLNARAEMNNVSRLLEQWQPQSAADNARYTQLLTDMDQWATERSIRNFTSRGSLPDIVWIVLLAGGAMTVGFTFLFHMKNAMMQALMTGVTAAMIAACLFLILSLDHPYAGHASVSPDPFAHMLDHFDDFIN